MMRCAACSRRSSRSSRRCPGSSGRRPRRTTRYGRAASSYVERNVSLRALQPTGTDQKTQASTAMGGSRGRAAHAAGRRERAAGGAGRRRGRPRSRSGLSSHAPRPSQVRVVPCAAGQRGTRRSATRWSGRRVVVAALWTETYRRRRPRPRLLVVQQDLVLGVAVEVAQQVGPGTCPGRSPTASPRTPRARRARRVADVERDEVLA